MITNRKFTGVLFIAFISYLVIDILFNDAIFYLLGGIFGTFSKWIGLENNAFYFVWLACLVGIIFIYRKIQNKLFEIIFILLLWALLYLVDALLYEITTNINNELQRYLHMSLAILLRSLILSWIYCLKTNKK
jgi:hypothetical protein